jgi:AcrR family transcriptional regulator
MSIAVSIGDGPEPAAELDRHSRRKLQTRRALRRAALALFADRGYEATTIADICHLADVSVRTFHLHFPTKEDVLFEPREIFPHLHRLIIAAPGELSDLAALEWALAAIQDGAAAESDIHHNLTQLLVRASQTSTVVLGSRMANAERIAVVVANALAERRGEETPSTATTMVAEAAMRIHHLSVNEWASADGGDLVAIFREHLEAFRCAISDPTRVSTGIPSTHA